LLAAVVVLTVLVVGDMAALVALVVSFTPPITTWALVLFRSPSAMVVLLAVLAVTIH
jgi:cytochrome c-type biogenesis protein CcmH/NrfF